LLSAGEVIRLLDLKPHPEGGHFRETFRDPRRIEGERAPTAVGRRELDVVSTNSDSAAFPVLML